MTWNFILTFLERRHLSDAVLTKLYVGRPNNTDMPGTDEDRLFLPANAATHLQRCGKCRHRRDDLVAFLNNIEGSGKDGPETALTPQRLLSQRQRIMRRLAAVVGSLPPAKVLRFPSNSYIEPRALRQHRWLPAAMAVGLVVGLAAGRAFDSRTTDAAQRDGLVAKADNDAFTSAPGGDALVDTQDFLDDKTMLMFAFGSGARGETKMLLDDETMLAEIDATFITRYGSTLSALNTLTPQVQEVVLVGR